ncbi:acyl-CoA dehydrogenase family protein, partial [Streptomyces koyangensis]
MKRSVFTADHEEFRSAVRDFLARDVVPNVDEYAENKLIAREVWHEAGKQGILGLEIPEAYGGGEAGDYRFNAVATEELAAVNMALASSFGIHFDIVTPYVVDLASEEQKQQWLPRMAAGEAVAAIGMT